jgi:hypothetical protein
MLQETTPLKGGNGICVKRLDDGHCIDIHFMFTNCRVVLSERYSDDSHGCYERGYCYFGFGVDANGKARTRESSFLAAMAAANVWDGTGDPPGFDKRAV